LPGRGSQHTLPGAFSAWQPDPCLRKQRIDGALELADHRPDPPTFHQPLPRAGVPGAPLPYASAHRTGAGSEPSPNGSVPNTTGPMRVGILL